MKFIYCVSLILNLFVLISQTKDICRCGSQQIFNQTSFECVDFPSNNQPGFVEGCGRYIISTGQQFSCDICQPSYYFQKGTKTCKKTNLEGCIYFSQKQSLSNTNIGQQEAISQKRFLDQNNDTQYNCHGCDTSQYYLQNEQCFKFPKSGEQWYTSNCVLYNYDDNKRKPACVRCQTGYYVDNDSLCNKYPNNVKNCESYYQLYNGTVVCAYCKDEYALTDNSQCDKTKKLIQNCEKALIYKICQECQQGYYVSQDESKCIKNPKKGEEGYIKNCQDYNSQLQCVKCDGKSALDYTNNKKCNDLSISKISHCVSYIEYGNDGQKCSQCQDKYAGINNIGIKECKKCPKVKGSGNIIYFGLQVITIAIMIIFII